MLPVGLAAVVGLAGVLTALWRSAWRRWPRSCPAVALVPGLVLAAVVVPGLAGRGRGVARPFALVPGPAGMLALVLAGGGCAGGRGRPGGRAHGALAVGLAAVAEELPRLLVPGLPWWPCSCW
ncbi:MAG TPA: hypothetical protein VMV92_04525 [Streptosporangiaceae bacterium]|nr:hypothetical protein [Streptosporangiaceae bacterium]